MLPRHPRRLPHGDRFLDLSLVPFGAEALEMFLRLEQPAPPGAPAEGDSYETVAQFYDAIEEGLHHLCAELGERERSGQRAAGDRRRACCPGGRSATPDPEQDDALPLRHSSSKPLCDGTHRKVDFRDEENTPAGSPRI
jgi:hypothetical protein